MIFIFKYNKPQIETSNEIKYFRCYITCFEIIIVNNIINTYNNKSPKLKWIFTLSNFLFSLLISKLY